MFVRAAAAALLLVSAAGAAADTLLGARFHPLARVYIPGGYFTMGADAEEQRYGVRLCRAEQAAGPCDRALFAVEGPAHRVFVSAFAIDRLEVSVAEYARCQAALRCPPPRVLPAAGESSGSAPVSGVTFAEAAGYCAFVGGRLPREAEWERAARGASLRRFPWGHLWNRRLANHAGPLGRDMLGRPIVRPKPGLRPVDAFPDGASAYGLQNMAGNVWELTADWFSADYYRRSPAVDPRGPASGDGRVIRGGSWHTFAHLLRVTTRRPFREGAFAPDVGFRCAYDVAP